MASFRCYDNSDVFATLIMTNFHLNITMVTIFPNACLWRHSLLVYSNLVLTPKTNCIKPSSYASTAYVVVIRPSSLSDSFVKIWATCEIFLGKWFTAPPLGKVSSTSMDNRSFITFITWERWSANVCFTQTKQYNREVTSSLMLNRISTELSS